MIDLDVTEKFRREHRKFILNNAGRKQSVASTLRTFRQNPKHPGLNLEKLQGLGTWTIRIDKGSRIFFNWTNNSTALLIDIGPHDKYRRH